MKEEDNMYEEYHYNKYWNNHCNHPPETYVCSYEVVEPYRDENDKSKLYLYQIDMYVYQGDLGTEICLRDGENPEDYFSVGQISDVCRSQQEFKKKAIRLLNLLGDITWVRKGKS